MPYPLLARIDSPADLRRLPVSQLPQVCQQLRDNLLASVAQTGGHLASGLGVIELTVAIHYVFNTPSDKLVWDVGHQAYPHKMLTGRRTRMSSLKRLDGLSGFPKRDESPYDAFGVGHSSTSISAVLGMALAEQLTPASPTAPAHIAVIGDGAMTAGMAFEALHHAGSLSLDNLNLLVIVNDNDMSISPNVGVLSAQLFKELGFHYTGPVDGHDISQLVRVLSQLKRQTGPQLLHVKTVKGKGYDKAEASPIAYHGVGAFDPQQGLPKTPIAQPPTFTHVFSQWLVDTAHRDERLIGITPAMCEGSGLVAFSQQFPARYVDVGIAEQHALTLAAGMACQGAKPVVAIYSTFLQRAYDQLIHDIALQQLDVLLAVDRAGIVGEDGATHTGAFDLAFARLIPNVVIMTPSDAAEMQLLLNTGYDYSGCALVRYPKGSGDFTALPSSHANSVSIGRAKVVQRGKKLAILVFGTLLARVRHYARERQATLIDMRFVKPLDTALIEELLSHHSHIVTLEEGCLQGGIGEQVTTFVHQQAPAVKVCCLGIGDTFVAHGTREEILAQCGLDEAGIRQRIEEFMAASLTLSV